MHYYGETENIIRLIGTLRLVKDALCTVRFKELSMIEKQHLTEMLENVDIGTAGLPGNLKADLQKTMYSVKHRLGLDH
jgi:hypothetical protein